MILYSVLLFLSLCLHIPVYFFRLKILRNEKLHLAERMGLRVPAVKSRKPSLWIHAVSVGEILSLRNLISRIKKSHPEWVIHISTLTNTGYHMAKEKLNGADNIFFIPFDFAFLIKKFFLSLHPQVFILAESEFWPNLIRLARKYTRGIILINGRISDRSFKRFRRFRPVIKKIINPINYFLVQTDKDKKRLMDTGIEESRIRIAGNLKAEILLPQFTEEEIQKLKSDLSIQENDQVVIAGSTHKGEDEILLEVFSLIAHRRPDLRFILAPRHPDRVEELEAKSVNLNLNPIRRTQVEGDPHWNVLFLDTFGELGRLYAVCDSAFIGGSLVPHGGQNLLEPAFYGKPVFFGPYMNNFAHLAELFLKTGAAYEVNGTQDLRRFFLMSDTDALTKQGNAARKLLESLQGATEKTIEIIENYMPDKNHEKGRRT